jgi:hypothetical protein
VSRLAASAGGADLVARVHRHQGQPTPDLQGRLDLRRLGRAHTVLGAQLAEIGAHQSGEPPVLRQQLVGQLERVVTPGAGAQDDGQQLGQRERLWAEVLQALSWALVAGQLAHGGVVVQPGVSIGTGVGFAGEHRRFSSLKA